MFLYFQFGHYQGIEKDICYTKDQFMDAVKDIERKGVDAILTRTGMLVKSEYREMNIHLGYRASESGEDAIRNKPAFYLAIGRIW